MKKKLLAMLLCVVLIFTIAPMAAFAENEVNVASVGDIQYKSFDEAVKAASDGDTVKLLADASSAGLNLSKNVIVDGDGHTLSFTDKGIALWGKTLTFNNCTVNIKGVGATPYGEWSWMTICASNNSSLVLNNTTMTVDGEGSSNAHCIYFTGNNKLNLTDSVLTIKNYAQDALEWDGGDGGYNVNLVNSTFNSDNNRSGFTGTFYATIDNSNVNVTNSLGNGSNGTYYAIKNNSNVVFTGNRNWGISAWRIDMTNGSTLTANDNGYSGIWTRVINADSSCTIDVERNGNHATGASTNAGIVFQGNGTYTSTIEDGADVTIKNNAGSGIYTKQGVCNLTIGSALITENGTGEADTFNGYGATYGGGVYNIGTMILGDNVEVYNNHASVAGDDIYSTKTVTFGAVAQGKSLDETEGTNDCAKAIDGWYKDEEGSRWTAHKGDNEDDSVYVELIEPASLSDTVAVKAAHGIKEVVSAKTAELSFKKVSSDDSKPIAGVEFALYADAACTTELAKAVSNDDGIVTFTVNIEAQSGIQNFYLKETKAAEGFEANDKVYAVSVNVGEPEHVNYFDDENEYTGEDIFSASAVTIDNAEAADFVVTNTPVTNPEPEKDDPSTPDKTDDTPKTGDDNQILMWTLMAAVSLTGIGASIVCIKTDRKRKQK